MPGRGPEDVVVDTNGVAYTGLLDGRVVRVRGDAVDVVADTGGRPLGLEVLRDGRILVCDSHRGLLRLDPSTGAIETLVREVGGVPLRFCSNAVEASDGTVYFTESTTRYGFEEYRSDLLEHSCTGRLFAYREGEVDVLLDGLAFANGVALSGDETFLVVAQTAAYELTKVPLDGSPPSTLVSNLPGFPDNISRGPSGLVWVALPNPRDARLDWLLPRAPWLRKVVHAIPERLQPQPTRTAWVIGVNEDGEVVRDLQRPGKDWAFATGVAEHDGELWLSSIEESALLVLSL
jgi:sugar lactone lactonase YvrE